MSTFSGEIQEIQGVCVDNFENKEMKCYFLSHCHSDHMKCLDNLSQISSSLYTTELSALIVKNRYPSLPNVRVLDYGIATNIEYTCDDGKEVKFIVTALNGTGHCMGACMFLFQIEGHDILYTGDFRLSLKHAKNIKILNEIRSYNKLVLYLDSTFLSDSYSYFPTQNDSCAKVIEIIGEHLRKSSSHRVCLQPSARYGYERLLMEINKKFNEKIYINESAIYEQYSLISELTNCITTDKHQSRISLRPSYISHKNDKAEDRNTLTVHLSAMFWRNLTAENPLSIVTADKLVRVCYATHCSLTEIKDFVEFLKPEKIIATVIPSNIKERTIMNSLIEQMLKTQSNNKLEENIDHEPKKQKFRFKRINKFIENKSENVDDSKKAKKMRMAEDK